METAGNCHIEMPGLEAQLLTALPTSGTSGHSPATRRAPRGRSHEGLPADCLSPAGLLERSNADGQLTDHRNPLLTALDLASRVTGPARPAEGSASGRFLAVFTWLKGLGSLLLPRLYGHQSHS